MSASTTPIIVGVGELTNRPTDVAEILEPLEMMARCTAAAEEDCGASLVAGLDSLTVVNLLSHGYADVARQLAERIGASPDEAVTTTVGGNTPQWRINELGERIAAGELRSALVAGGEAFHSVKLAGKAGATLDWGPKGKAGTMIGDRRMGTNDVEMRHQAQLPIRVYPMFESALRAERGISIEEHHALLGRLCAGLSAVAAENPIAWFRQTRSADEITADEPHNRFVGFPYRKYMNAIMNVDQAAAVLITSVEHARSLGIPESKWIYLRGCGDANDLWFTTDRIDLHSSPAIELAGKRAFEQAGIGPADLDHVDIYSCFPSALQISARMLGVADDGSRPLTVTGGLPYHGGPGSNYSTHAIARTVRALRAETSPSYGLVTGVGWYMTKHSVGIYSNAAPEAAWKRHDVAADQATLDAQTHPAHCEDPAGACTIEAYTVVHDRDGSPSFGIATVRLEDGRRAWTNIVDTAALVDLEHREGVGRRATVAQRDEDRVNILSLP